MKARVLLAVSWPIITCEGKGMFSSATCCYCTYIPANRNEVAMEATSISDNVFLLLIAGSSSSSSSESAFASINSCNKS